MSSASPVPKPPPARTETYNSLLFTQSHTQKNQSLLLYSMVGAWGRETPKVVSAGHAALGTGSDGFICTAPLKCSHIHMYTGEFYLCIYICTCTHTSVNVYACIYTCKIDFQTHMVPGLFLQLHYELTGSLSLPVAPALPSPFLESHSGLRPPVFR